MDKYIDLTSYLLCQLYQMKVNSQLLPSKFGHWKVIQKIGEGSFGSIYSVQNTQSAQKYEKIPYAIKTESIANIKRMLQLQYQIYKQFEGERGFPKVIQFVQEQRYSYLVMQRLQNSLDKYAAKCFPKQFLPTDTLLQVMLQILKIIQKIHRKGYLYRDMKPANFMLRDPYQQIYIIDFGLCKKYLNNNRHIKMKENKKLVGTPIFCSINTHAGLQQSRRDDLQSWIFACLYFSIELPWQGVMNRKQLNKQSQYSEIHRIKKQTNWESIIESYNANIRQSNRNPNFNQLNQKFTQIPSCIIKILAYVRALQFEQEPDYNYLQGLIKDQYYRLVGEALENYTINWISKLRLQPQLQQKKVDTKPIQIQQLPSPVDIKQNKIKKINFKAPLKSKVINVQNQKPNIKEQGQNLKTPNLPLNPN